MGSKKPSARAKQAAAFKADLFGAGATMGDLFAREEERSQRQAAEHEAAVRRKACESKNRYASRAEAEENLRWCESRGTKGLHIYRCPHCKGWHLTSHSFDD